MSEPGTPPPAVTVTGLKVQPEEPPVELPFVEVDGDWMVAALPKARVELPAA
jgi:hypothetical protein